MNERRHLAADITAEMGPEYAASLGMMAGRACRVGISTPVSPARLKAFRAEQEGMRLLLVQILKVRGLPEKDAESRIKADVERWRIAADADEKAKEL